MMEEHMKNCRKYLAAWIAIMVVAAIFYFGNEGTQTVAASLTQESGTEIEVEPALLNQFRMAADGDESGVGYLIYFRERPDLSPAYEMDWDARGRFVVAALQEAAESAQEEVRVYLDSNRVDYQAFWVDNVIVVQGSSQGTFNGLLSFGEISALRARRTLTIPEPTWADTTRSAGDELPPAVELNITHVGAAQVWALGYRGEGIVVANIDTGVRGTHESLLRQYRGTATSSDDYNWLGAAGGSATPVDDHSHGSHTMGTILGENFTLTNQTGMAPGAQWIACDGCEGTSCPDAALLTCAEWIIAPYPSGQPRLADPDKRPHVVNNSWGDCGRSYDGWYQSSVDAWQAAGIFPVFSNGNSSNCGYPSPPGLNTVGNPARYGNVTGVGSTGKNNGTYATHSNWGPTDFLDTINPNGFANIKPQVVAPGVSIRSAINSGNSSYASWNGTSMSAPHVTGLVALMWQAAPCLIGNYAATETIIQETATPIPYATGNGDEGPGNVPNHATGWGEINALEAVRVAIEFCSIDVTPESQKVCAPAEVQYDVQVGPGFSADVTLSVFGNPSGTSTAFSVNPVAPETTSILTVSVSGASTAGNYDFSVVGTAPAETYSDMVTLEISTASPSSSVLLAPTDGTTAVSVQTELSWTSVPQTESYYLEIARDSGFATVAYTATVSSANLTIMDWLDYSTQYYWRVRADNFCGVGPFSEPFDFTTQDSPTILLVDDDDNSPDVRAYYSDTLSALGYEFSIWDTHNSDTEPGTRTLNNFEVVIWFTGYEWGNVTGPGSAGEAALADWLENDKCFLISSQDYHYARNLTSFMDTYLGIDSVSDDVLQTTVTGTGYRFNILGSYSLSYPFTNWSDNITPDTDASVAFIGNKGNAAIKKNAGSYKTSFWAFPFESIPTAPDREAAMQAFLDWCGPVIFYFPLVFR